MYTFHKNRKYPHRFRFDNPDKESLKIFIEDIKKNFQSGSFKTICVPLKMDYYLSGKIHMQEFLDNLDKSQVPVGTFFIYFKDELDASTFKLLFCDNMNKSNSKDITKFIRPLIEMAINQLAQSIL